jgi:ubiquinone/menaquinone biosynthesis C-methylase UbiE
MSNPPDSHDARIREQFTKQAEPFAAFRIHSNEVSLDWMKEDLRLSGAERVVDAGCGPGLVACHLAPFARELVGVDATPAMLAKAREIAAQRGCTNTIFLAGQMEQLPCESASFDGAVSRYTLHHVLDPDVVLAELVRVCRPGARVVLCDASPRSECREAYDAWERMRDPSHTTALTPEELLSLAERHLGSVSVRTFRLDTPVETLLDSSFPVPGGRERLFAQMRTDLGTNALDMDARLVDGVLHMAFPVMIVAGTVASRSV